MLFTAYVYLSSGKIRGCVGIPEKALMSILSLCTSTDRSDSIIPEINAYFICESFLRHIIIISIFNIHCSDHYTSIPCFHNNKLKLHS